MFPYVEERFTAEEEAILRRYFTNLDEPVFALVNLPEVVKGALFARYSRSAKSLRRLFLDEFVGDLDISGDATVDATVGLARAEQLYERVFFEYGDDSVAQLGRRPPGLRAGLQRAHQGPRAGPPDGLPGAVDPLHRLRHPAAERPLPLLPPARNPRLAPRGPLRGRHGPDVRRLRRAAAQMVSRGSAPATPASRGLGLRPPPGGQGQGPRRPAGPAAGGLLSNVGIYGTGQSYELLLLRMRATRCPRPASYAE